MRSKSFLVRFVMFAMMLVAHVFLSSCGDGRASEPARALSLAATGGPGVASVVLAPTTVAAWQNATGTVTLSAPAPSGGVQVALYSNNVAVATVPPSVTVLAGSTSAPFTVTSRPMASPDWAAISATSGQVTQTAVLNVTPSGVTLASLAVAPTLLPGGTSGVGTVTLSGAAPAGGAVVALSSADPTRASVPASVTVPEGATAATFAVTALIVDSASGHSISGVYGGVTRSAWIVVTEPPPSGRQLTSVSLSSELVVGGQSVQGTVTLASAEGADTRVTLTSTNTSVATLPAFVTVPAGAGSAAFTLTTRPTTSSDFSVIIAEAGGVERSTTITTIAPPTGPRITALTFFPSSVGGGGPVTGRVTLSGPATDGAQVALVSENPAIVGVPASIVVIRNATSADFPVTTSVVSSTIGVAVNATGCCGGQGNATRVLTVTTDAPPPPDVVRIERADFKPGGRGGTLTVRATSTSATAILTVFRNQSTVPTFTLTNKGGGRYEGSFSFSGTKPQTVTVTSNLGGAASANVR